LKNGNSAQITPSMAHINKTLSSVRERKTACRVKLPRRNIVPPAPSTSEPN
jgi:hypothetical protein